MRVAVLAGGVGGAKLAHGFAMLPGVELTVIVNTGDDLELHGLSISPDVDTVLYTLAGLANAETGWGLRDETWSAHAMLARYGAPTWFRLGDRDLATHLVRTRRLRAGATPTDVTGELAQALGVRARVLPMSDRPVRTRVRVADGWLDFQEWFVAHRHADDALEIRFEGIEDARPTERVIAAVGTADLVALAPSNPFVSIGPILALPGMLAALERAPVPVVAVSPIVAGAALKGPADRMLETLGGESSALGVARHYAEHYPGLLDGLAIDRADAVLAPGIEALGIRVLTTHAIMADDEGRARLAREVLEFAAAREAPPPARGH
ncbi:MAG: 2-phospho-L-lactate transferase [Candidatus Limnocylindrales bacterium]